MVEGVVISDVLMPGVDQYGECLYAGAQGSPAALRVADFVVALQALGIRVETIRGTPHDHPPLYRDPGCLVLTRP